MKKPSKAQKKAINHLSGPAQIIAGPGSGKTFTIIQRILYLIQYYHVRPDKILVITYTKAAANERSALNMLMHHLASVLVHFIAYAIIF